MITIDQSRSISGRAAMLFLRFAGKTFLSGMRRPTAASEIEKGLKISKKMPFAMPKDKKAAYKEMVIAGYPCLCMRKKGQQGKSRKAILYLHGGMQNLWKSEISIARGYMDRTGYDLRYPIYPSPTEVPITESIRVCYEMYRRLAADYGPENTVIVGSSCGGYYAMQILNQINLQNERANLIQNLQNKQAAEQAEEQAAGKTGAMSGAMSEEQEGEPEGEQSEELEGEPAGMPALAIALSPNGIPERREERRHMKELSEKDPMISFSALMVSKEIAKWYDKEAPNYTIYPVLLDLRDAPPVYFYYGEETVAGNAECYQRAFEKSGCGEQVHIHIQKGMMHDYACMPVFPESRRAYEEQIRMILNA